MNEGGGVATELLESTEGTDSMEIYRGSEKRKEGEKGRKKAGKKKTNEAASSV